MEKRRVRGVLGLLHYTSLPFGAPVELGGTSLRSAVVAAAAAVDVQTKSCGAATVVVDVQASSATGVSHVSGRNKA